MPALLWDEGTAYDLFVSLYVLHRPITFGLRASWAAGVRSRLPNAQRDFLEKIESFLPVPLSWLYLLPAEAKTAAGALYHLAQLPAAERLPSLLFTTETPTEVITTLQAIALRQTWSSAEQEVLRASLISRGINSEPEALSNTCEAWTDLTASGERFLDVLTTYYQVFFAEEEQRIRPILREASANAFQRAQVASIGRLLDELSHGVHFEQLASTAQVILAPSYWSSPLIFYNRLPDNRLIVLFGARSAKHDLTPGKELPQDLVETMKAIADPTRLRILHYLAAGALVPSELARLLRLRPPTVVHHLNELRLVGLVEIQIFADGERAYGVRQEALQKTISMLFEFLAPQKK